MRIVSLATAGLLTLSGLVVTSAPARAAAVGTANPSSVANDARKTIVVTAPGVAFYPADQESVVLHPQGAPDASTDRTAEVSNVGSCSPPLFPDADCGDQLSLAVDLTNAAPGAYDVVETATPAFGGDPTTRTLAVVQVRSLPLFAGSAPLAPASGGQGARSLSVTVTGRGFAPGLVADFGTGAQVTEVRVPDPTSAVVSLQLALDAPQGPRDVTLTSADGLSSTATGAFTVNAGPVVTAITPATLQRGSSTSVTVSGTGFVSGDGFTLALSGTQVSDVVATATQITATIATTPTAATGPRTVRVRNPDGGEGALEGGFAVVAPPGPVSGLGVVLGDTTAALAWTVPSDPGSSAVTGYAVTATAPSGTLTQTVSATPATFTGLVNGQAYSFAVVPRNDSGDGPASTVAGTPRFATAVLLTAPSVTTAGRDLVVRGTLLRTRTGAPAPGASVVLTYTPQVGAAITRTVTTGSDGRFTSTTRAVYTTTVTAAFAGREQDRPSTASPLLAPVAARVSVVSPTSGSASSARTPVTVVGSVSPNKAGRPVGLFFGTRLVGRAVVASNGSFRIPVTLPRGNYRLFVNINPTTGNLAGRSPAFILKRL